MPAPDLAYAIGLPPTDAIAYFESLGYRVSANALETYEAIRARAFTVTGIGKLDVLEDIKAALGRSLAEGQTYGQFKGTLDELLRRRGWLSVPGAGAGMRVDPATGEVGATLPGWHLKTIFRNNMQSALQTGKYRQAMEQVDLAPYWQYVATMDNRTRPSHAAAHGKVFRHDDPFWDSHFPPCDHNCRCGFRVLSEAMVKARGLDVLEGKNYLEDTKAFVTKDVVKPARAFVDPVTQARFVSRPGFGTRPSVSGGGDGAGGVARMVIDKLRAADPQLAAAVTASTPALQGLEARAGAARGRTRRSRQQATR